MSYFREKSQQRSRASWGGKWNIFHLARSYTFAFVSKSEGERIFCGCTAILINCKTRNKMNSERLHFLRVPLHFEHESTLNANERAPPSGPQIKHQKCVYSLFIAQISLSSSNQFTQCHKHWCTCAADFHFRSAAHALTEIHKIDCIVRRCEICNPQKRRRGMCTSSSSSADWIREIIFFTSDRGSQDRFDLNSQATSSSWGRVGREVRSGVRAAPPLRSNKIRKRRRWCWKTRKRSSFIFVFVFAFCFWAKVRQIESSSHGPDLRV